MDSTLPLRFSLLTVIESMDHADLPSCKDKLKGAYGSERQFTDKNLLGHMMALKENGYIDEVGSRMEDGKVLVSFAINDAGREVVARYK